MSPVFIFGSSLSLDWAQAQLKSTWLSRPSQVLVGQPTSFTWKDANTGATSATYVAPHQLPLGHPRKETRRRPHAFHMPSPCLFLLGDLGRRRHHPPLPSPTSCHDPSINGALKILEETKPQSKPSSKPSSQSVHARMEGQRTHSPLQAFNLAMPKAPSIWSAMNHSKVGVEGSKEAHPFKQALFHIFFQK